MRCLRNVCPLLATLFIFLPGSALYAQTSNYPIQVFTLGVQDRRGQFVDDIQPDQIVIKEPAASIQHFEFDNAPRRILLLLDTSGSIGDYKSLSWSNVAQFAIRFTLQRKGDDSIGLDAFAEKDQVLVPFTIDSQSLVRHIESLTSSGRGRKMLGKALDEILVRGEDGLRFGDAIILVSDGERNVADKTNFAQLRDKFIRAGVRICLVRVPSVMPPGVFSDLIDASQFVSETGGIELNMVGLLPVQSGSGVRVDPQTMESTVKTAYAFTRTYYQLGLEISEPIQKPRQLRLEIVDKQKGKIKDLHLNYPRYLLPPPEKK